MPSKKKDSPFKEILSNVKQPEATAPKQAAQAKETRKTAPKRGTAKTSAKKKADTPPPAGTRGKSSNKEFYTQATLYLRKDTHRAIKKKLLDDEQGRDMSDLAQELFAQWLIVNS